MSVCNSVYESTKSVAFTLRKGTFARRLVLFVILFGAIVVMQAGFLKHSDLAGNSVLSVWGVTLQSVLHISYLYLVFWLLILKEAPHRIYFQQMIFPLLVFVGYVFHALGAYVYYENIFGQSVISSININNAIPLQHAFEVASLACFQVLYILWFLRDACEIRECRNPHRKKHIKAWWLLELISLVAIGGALLNTLELIALKAAWSQYFFSKDTAIFLSLTLWVVLVLAEQSEQQSNYRDYYEDYLDFNEVIGVNPVISIPSMPDDSVILDIGCANGRRFNEITSWIGVSNADLQRRYNVVGYDNDETWRSLFEQNVSAKSVKFLTEADAIDYQQVSLVILSHVLYEPDIIDSVSSILSRCTNGAIVVIRGTSPSSFFSTISAAFSLRLWNPTKSHAWLDHQLPIFISGHQLTRVNKKLTAHQPDSLVNQRYSLNANSIERAGKLLTYLYSTSSGEIAQRFFRDLIKIAGISHLPNDDLIFVYEISRR